jgi:phosphoenolpyruvate carboxylase
MGVSALIKASRGLVTDSAQEKTEYLGIMQQLAELGEQQYRKLTEQTPGFLDYFYEACPISEIGLMNIGSRPSHRKAGDRSKSSVRAIGWVFAWAQSRHTLPGWYGIGSAIALWVAEDPSRRDILQKMYFEWPFFRAMVSNTQMSLSKADMEIAAEYADLCIDKQQAAEVLEVIRQEYQQTVSQLLQLTGADKLMAENPLLALSLRRRQAYLDPLNHIQLLLLRRYRHGGYTETETAKWRDPLLRSISAISQGMRNTG